MVKPASVAAIISVAHEARMRVSRAGSTGGRRSAPAHQAAGRQTSTSVSKSNKIALFHDHCGDEQWGQQGQDQVRCAGLARYSDGRHGRDVSVCGGWRIDRGHFFWCPRDTGLTIWFLASRGRVSRYPSGFDRIALHLTFAVWSCSLVLDNGHSYRDGFGSGRTSGSAHCDARSATTAQNRSHFLPKLGTWAHTLILPSSMNVAEPPMLEQLLPMPQPPTHARASTSKFTSVS